MHGSSIPCHRKVEKMSVGISLNGKELGTKRGRNAAARREGKLSFQQRGRLVNLC